MSAYRSSEYLQPVHASPMISRPRKSGLITRILNFIGAFRDRVRERQELQGMSPVELRDIGITRGDIDRVCGPEFAHEYATRGNFRRQEERGTYSSIDHGYR